MKTVSTEQMRGIDRAMIDTYGVSGELLMDRAGFGVADCVRRLAAAYGFDDPRIALFAGRGNNGGDAFVAARYLHEIDMDVEVYFAGNLRAVSGDARLHLRLMRDAGVPLQELETMDDWEALLHSASWGADILVDGLLGTGSRGPARGPVAGAIQVINRFSDDGLVVAIDIPSGLDADHGVCEGDAVIADVTATMGLPKTGLLLPCAVECVGRLEVIDIGIEPALIDAVPEGIQLITYDGIGRLLGRRPRRAHKGTFGHVLLVGGGKGYSGAMSMAAMAACRSGVGLVSVLVPETIVATVAACVPEAMVYAGHMTETGSLAADALQALGDRGVSDFDAILIGPGMTTHPAGAKLVESVLDFVGGTVVLDADALSLVAASPACLERSRACDVIMTPHPGEMGRLLGMSTDVVESDRFVAAQQAVERFGGTCVLKGAGTIVADATRMSVNLTGNPGMACGGMGDVLAGVLTGLAAQSLHPFDAACAAVYLHGCAGDDVARHTSEAGLTATAVAYALPHAFRRVQLR